MLQRSRGNAPLQRQPLLLELLLLLPAGPRQDSHMRLCRVHHCSLLISSNTWESSSSTWIAYMPRHCSSSSLPQLRHTEALLQSLQSLFSSLREPGV